MTARRGLLLVAGAFGLGGPSAALAQKATGKRRIAYLGPATAAAVQHLTAVFRAGLRDLGWIEGDSSALLNELNPKRLSLLKEAFPRQEKVGVLFRDGEPSNRSALAPLVDRILRGADPATIPVEQANVYELVINLRTARTLGVELPRSLLLQATRVIE